MNRSDPTWIDKPSMYDLSAVDPSYLGFRNTILRRPDLENLMRNPWTRQLFFFNTKIEGDMDLFLPPNLESVSLDGTIKLGIGFYLSVAGHQNLDSIFFDSRALSKKEAEYIAQSRINHLRSTNNHHLDPLIEAVAKKDRIRMLDFSNSRAMDIKSYLRLARMKNLRWLNLSNQQIELLEIAIRAIAKSRQIGHLDLSDNDITVDTVKLLAENEHFYSLTLDDNPFGDRGSELLAKSQTLKKLSLQGVRIGKRTLDALAKNRTLEDLEITLHPGVDWNRLRRSVEKGPMSRSLKRLFLWDESYGGTLISPNIFYHNFVLIDYMGPSQRMVNSLTKRNRRTPSLVDSC